jgi:hypothetical protein
MKKPFERYILFFLLILLAANAFYGGLSFIIAPDGSLLKMEPGWLDGSPFHSFLIPGILLLIFNGIFPLIALFGLLSKNKWQWINFLNIFRDKSWGWTFSLYCGIVTNIWIIAQQLMAGFFILQPIIAAVGLFILVAALLPRTMRYYTTDSK